jgi:hypothetical protein
VVGVKLDLCWSGAGLVGPATTGWRTNHGENQMPKMQTTVSGLNTAFSEPGVKGLVAQRDRFAPGEPLHTALADHGATPGTPLHHAFREHLRKLPGAVSETLRATIHHALGTTPPTHITFAWAPSYDHEITVWHAPDAEDTKGGITVLIKSRYPNDPHPLDKTAR